VKVLQGFKFKILHPVHTKLQFHKPCIAKTINAVLCKYRGVCIYTYRRRGGVVVGEGRGGGEVEDHYFSFQVN
jgi:hypothetical protein